MLMLHLLYLSDIYIQLVWIGYQCMKNISSDSVCAFSHVCPPLLPPHPQQFIQMVYFLSKQHGAIYQLTNIISYKYCCSLIRSRFAAFAEYEDNSAKKGNQTKLRIKVPLTTKVQSLKLSALVPQAI